MKSKFGLGMTAGFIAILGLFYYWNFCGQRTVSKSNLWIDGGMLVLAGLIILVCVLIMNELGRLEEDLRLSTLKIRNEYLSFGLPLDPSSISFDSKSVIFKKKMEAFQAETNRIKRQGGLQEAGLIDFFIDEDVIEQAAKKPLLNQVPGLLQGLGILGTFIGLCQGLSSVSLDGDTASIIQSMSPLIDGMSVAFHTSVYGLALALLFNFFYKMEIENAWGQLNTFADCCHSCFAYSAKTDQEVLHMQLSCMTGIRNAMVQMEQTIGNYEKQRSKEVERMSQNVQKTLNDYITATTKAQQLATETLADHIFDRFSDEVSRMDGRFERGFENLGQNISHVFDKELAEITRHLSGTIAEVEATVDQVPDTVENAYQGMEDAFTRMQKNMESMIHLQDLKKEEFDARLRLADKENES